tara:strand:- start:2043 stop:2201 length:159 start_codon:yes stop_codon:yes gene_type:complete
MSYLFWAIMLVVVGSVYLVLWLITWIAVDFIVKNQKGKLEDVIHAKWGKDNE